VGEALEIAAQVAAALSAAHAAGVVHRDIKPENIMLRPDGYVKALDFGLAKLTEKTTPSQPADSAAATQVHVSTDAGTVLGTISYMSPEQARGLAVDARTDIWSLGVCLYEMIANRPPFERETKGDVLAAILHTEPPALHRYAPDAPAELARIVTKALRKDKEERYQSIKELGLDLKSLKQRLEFEAELERTGTPERNREAGQPTAKSVDGDLIPGATPAATIPVAGARTDDAGEVHTTASAEYLAGEIKRHRRGVAVGLAILLLAAIGVGLWFFSTRSANNRQIESIAVLPFVNASGNADVEYLSDGMTETLINSLSQLPKLNVKARSTVFRYKGKDIEAQQVGSELNVQAILHGRVVQRGDELTLSLELVEARNGNQLWGEQYNRKLTDLVSLQKKIARDVSQKLGARLSGADKQKATKDYTANAEAYQLYLKGRYHVLKLKPSENQKGISYYQQAIAIDPNYALAYAGLAEAYRSLTLFGEMRPTEFLPQAKAAAQRAIEIDDTLAEAHAGLGFAILFYDWDWKTAEKQYQRALELNPNSADAHLAYAGLFSVTGRPAEALAEVKRARELDPLNLRANALEGQFLILAGQTDEGLARLQKTIELDPNFWFAHNFAASAYTEKGMYTEAIAAARKARELSGFSTQPTAFLGYALAKSSKGAEARAELEALLRLSKERYVPPYHVALIYNGLGERDETLAWLERGFEQRDPRMIVLKVEPKWNNLRADPRFQELLRRVGLPQ
ncbi:MAG: protein kinase domain-containing protein, partial [Pyrinomonadaceae bacterium]